MVDEQDTPEHASFQERRKHTFFPLDTFGVGRLDPLGSDIEVRDANIIRSYIRTEISARAVLGEKTPPSIARAVLTSVWEAPRLQFHRQQKRGLRGIDLRNKLLLIPWSVEASEQMRRNVHVSGLILEHVTPVFELWCKLESIHREAEAMKEQAETPEDESDGDAHWEFAAVRYLQTNYVLSVLTRQQAAAIDKLPDLKTTGNEGYPFGRYEDADRQLRALSRETGKVQVPFDVGRFVVLGRPTGGQEST